jgi:hypothetical protein
MVAWPPNWMSTVPIVLVATAGALSSPRWPLWALWSGVFFLGIVLPIALVIAVSLGYCWLTEGSGSRIPTDAYRLDLKFAAHVSSNLGRLDAASARSALFQICTAEGIWLTATTWQNTTREYYVGRLGFRTVGNVGWPIRMARVERRP